MEMSSLYLAAYNSLLKGENINLGKKRMKQRISNFMFMLLIAKTKK